MINHAAINVIKDACPAITTLRASSPDSVVVVEVEVVVLRGGGDFGAACFLEFVAFHRIDYFVELSPARSPGLHHQWPVVT